MINWQAAFQFAANLWNKIPSKPMNGYSQSDIDRLIQITNNDYSQVKPGGLAHQVDMAKQLYAEYSKSHPENYNKKNFAGFLTMNSAKLALRLCNTDSRYLFLLEQCNMPSFPVFYIYGINRGYIGKDSDGYLAWGKDLDSLVDHFYPSRMIDLSCDNTTQEEMTLMFMDSRKWMALIRVGWYDKQGKPKLPSTHTLRIARTFDDKIICLDTDHHDRSGMLLTDICPKVVWIESMYWYES